MTALCTVVTSAAGARCSAPAVVERASRFGGMVAECAAHASPAPSPVAVAEVVGRRVRVRHCGVVKVGVVVAEIGASRFAVEVPVKPHGKPAGRKVIRVEREAVRFA